MQRGRRRTPNHHLSAPLFMGPVLPYGQQRGLLYTRSRERYSNPFSATLEDGPDAILANLQRMFIEALPGEDALIDAFMQKMKLKYRQVIIDKAIKKYGDEFMEDVRRLLPQAVSNALGT